MKSLRIVILCLSIAAPSNAQKLLVPMDLDQTDHLKAYGVAFWALERGIVVEWLLNFKGGSFLTDATESLVREARLRDVSFNIISTADVARIYGEIENENMDRVRLEKAPRIAVYTPPNKQPWDDAVTLALAYAEIPYDTLWDEEVLQGGLDEYDWLHLHHEDFTGQYGKFYRSHGRQQWYRQQQRAFEQMARRLGFEKVSTQKSAVVEAIAEYVRDGGFLFAMCSATDTFDIARAAWGLDIVDTIYDGDPIDSSAHERLNFSTPFAFQDFTLVADPMEYEYSDIDVSPTEEGQPRGADADAFTLFELFESKMEQHGKVTRAAIELAKEWRTDRRLRRLEALLCVADTENSFIISGNGDVIEPEDNLMAIGSGGPFAQAAALALVRNTKFDAAKIVEKALHIAGDICVYTNQNIIIETLDANST